MNASLFRKVTLSERSLFQRLFNQHPEENAVIELNNLLATQTITSLPLNILIVIGGKYNLNMQREFRLNLEEFYATYLNFCLAGRRISDEASQDLQHLKKTLLLDEECIARLHQQIGSIVYKEAFEEAIVNGRLTIAQQTFLNKFSTDLGITQQVANTISQEVRTAYVKNYVARIIADERLSPDEEKELSNIATSLHISLEFDEQTKQKLERLKRYWALENLDLPVFQPDIIIQKSEECYFQLANVNWYELRSVRQRSISTGYSTRIKVAKGFYLKVGSRTSNSYSTSQMTLIDTGSLYLTNKRIIFTGLNKNSNIRFEKILNLNPLDDGVEIEKETGKSPVLQFPKQADVFCILLERLLRER